MLATLQTFLGLAHRCQWTANIAGVDWYNDSKGTNVSSTLAAIEGLGSITSGKLVLIAGGLGKNQDFSPLRAVVTRYVRSVVLIGQDKQDIAEDLKNTVPLLFAENLAHAIEIARNQASKGDAVLLSPACASFDMFRNFEDRGEKFMQLVKNENQT
jgi:UDP-N-acetylmuramoylalanine--D-glutamate ligase